MMTPTRRISAPTFPALTDANLREWLRIDPAGDEATLAMLLSAAVDYVEGITNKIVLSADYETTLPAGYTSFRLTASPINSLSILRIDDLGTLVPLSATIASYATSLDYMMGSLSYLTGAINRGVTIRYNAGYTSPETIPDGLRYAIAILVQAGYNGREDIDPKTFETVSRLVQRHRRYVL